MTKIYSSKEAKVTNDTNICMTMQDVMSVMKDIQTNFIIQKKETNDFSRKKLFQGFAGYASLRGTPSSVTQSICDLEVIACAFY